MTHLLAGQARARRFVDAAPESSAATVAGGDASSPIGRGLPALASQGAKRPRRLGWKGEGFRLLRKGPNPSPFPPNLAPLAKAESPLPMGEEPVVNGRSFPETMGQGTTESVTLSLAAYESFLATIPPTNRAALTERWGAPEDDPLFADGAFRLAIHRFGNVVVAIQPGARLRDRSEGDLSRSRSGAAAPLPRLLRLAPRSLRRRRDGPARQARQSRMAARQGARPVARRAGRRSRSAPLPLVYPFIVNDPGEGAQAKRRASAVIVDHLMPAMTRAEVHGGLAELETLIDEYYLAAGIDPRRRAHLEREILATAERHALDRDLGFDARRSSGALRALDAYLCELKEMQIRDGLHTLGSSPEGAPADRHAGRDRPRSPLRRTPRRPVAPSRHRRRPRPRDFDPLDCDPAAPWTGPRPDRARRDPRHAVAHERATRSSASRRWRRTWWRAR